LLSLVVSLARRPGRRQHPAGMMRTGKPNMKRYDSDVNLVQKSVGALHASPSQASGLGRIVEASDDSGTVSSLTKVICTVGVKSRTVEELIALLEAGMNIARFDFSWGSMAYHTKTLENLREAQRRTKILCATMLDTRGPEIGIELAPKDVTSFDANAPRAPVVMTQGNRVTLTTDATVPASAAFLPVNTPELVNFVHPGDDIFVGQYLFTGSETSSVYLKVDEVDAKAGTVTCTARNDAKLSGVLLTVQVANKQGEDMPTLSEWDRRVVKEWAAPNEVDFVSVSFTPDAAAIRECKELLADAGIPGTKVLAKVERLAALRNVDEIVAAADGVILSRGNLGLDMPPEKVFLSQKMVLFKCNAGGKPIVVTRVVDTMTETPRPTRAEATDVANAVLDGADAILLGAETLRGAFAAKTVDTVRRICRQAEKVFDHENHYQQQLPQSVMDEGGGLSQSEALASSAVRAASKVGAAMIVVFTRTGHTARLVSKYRPNMPIVSLVIPRVTQNSIRWVLDGEQAARQGLLNRGVIPLLANPTNSDMSALLRVVFDFAKKKGTLTEGDQVVVIQKVGTTSVVKVVPFGKSRDSTAAVA
jgi:pyruvate kinase